MKKNILALAFLLFSTVASTFANENETNKLAVASFSKDFVSAKNVSWEKRSGMNKVTFTLNDHVMSAYYNEQGELIAATRDVLSTEIPLSLFIDLKKNYQDHWITNLFEVAAHDETSYYVTLENAEESIVLKSNSYGEWSVYKRTKKNIE